MSPIQRRIALAVLAAVVLVAAVWTLWNVLVARDLANAIAEARAAGLAASLSELEPAPIPAAENAARLYEAAFALASALPAPGRDGWWDDLPRVPAEVRTAIPAFGEALELTHRAGRLPACRFDLHYQDGLTMRVPHLPQMRLLGQLLAARGALRAEEADLEGAQQDLHALFAMTRALRDEPLMVSQEIRLRLAKIGLDVLDSVLARSPSKAAVIERVQPDDCRGAVSYGIRGDCALWLSLFDGEILTAIPRQMVPRTWRIPLLRGPLWRVNLAYATRVHVDCRQALALPYPEAMARVRTIEERCDADGNALTRSLVAAFSGALDNEADIAAAVDRLRAPR